jgi:dTDP-4-dehydrorhamnose 3,5-epimerase-like enzyme
MDIDKLTIEEVKKVATYDHNSKPNGFLMELFKDNDSGEKTEIYLSAALPGAFKGFHLHRVRAARYVCLKGKMRIITYQNLDNHWVRSEHILDAENSQRLFIPKNIATGLENIGTEEAWLINYPDPAYDPSLRDEQIEYSREELEAGVVK